MIRAAFSIGVATAISLPPIAVADPMDLPEGCSGFLTIQLANCTVINHWTCPSDPADHYRLATFDRSGLPIRHMLMEGLTSKEMLGRPNDPRVFTFTTMDPEIHAELMQNGSDSYTSVIHEKGVFLSRVTGESLLTGTTTQIDGVFLHEVQSTSTFTNDANVTTGQKRVVQYVMDQDALALDIWVPGELIDIPTGEVELDFNAVDFIWPDERGSMTTQPTINCGPVTS